MGKLWRRIGFILQRRRLEHELAEEMEAHRELMPPDRRSNFGNSTRLREESREVWSWNWVEQLSQDLSYGARVLRRTPGFTLGAIAVLALGIGVNLAEFEIFDSMLFHRYTFRDADSSLQFTHASRLGQRMGFPSGAVEFYREERLVYLAGIRRQQLRSDGGRRYRFALESGIRELFRQPGSCSGIGPPSG